MKRAVETAALLETVEKPPQPSETARAPWVFPPFPRALGKLLPGFAAVRSFPQFPQLRRREQKERIELSR